MKWLAGIALVIWATWALTDTTHTLRWKLTIEVETPQGISSGASVLESSFFQQSGVVRGASSKLLGQAIFVDLGDGKHIIAALVHGERAQSYDAIAALPVTAMTGAGWGWSAYQELSRRNGSLTGNAELRPPLIPTLVHFLNLNDPRSARVLDPFDGSFETALGPGYRFSRATVEIVPTSWSPFSKNGPYGETVTRGIETRLPWLKVINGYLSGASGCNCNTEPCLDIGHFMRK